MHKHEKGLVRGRFHPGARQFILPVLLLKFLASYLHTSREIRLMKQPTPCPPPVRFRYESAPGGNISPSMPPYDHRVGFICIGGTPQLGCLGQPGGTWGTPHTHKTNLVAIGGHVLAHITPGGRLIPKLHRGRAGGRLFISLCAESALIPKTFETEWYGE